MSFDRKRIHRIGVVGYGHLGINIYYINYEIIRNFYILRLKNCSHLCKMLQLSCIEK